MAIAGTKPLKPMENISDIEPQEKVTYDTVVKDHETTNIYSLIPYIDGSKLSVEYYNQVLGADESPKRPDRNTPTHLQQYTVIHELILNVTQAIEQGKYSDIGGTAFLDANIRPYKGDVLLFTLMNGKTGFFIVNGVEKKDYLGKQLYELTYVLDQYISDNNDVDFRSLKQKVINEYYYNPDHYINNNSPLLTNEEYSRILDYERVLDELSIYYFDKFKHYKYKLHSAPINEVYVVVDPHLEDFAISYSVTDISDSLRHLHRSYDPFDMCDSATIWDVLRRREPRLLKHIPINFYPINDFGLFNQITPSNNPYLMGVDYVIKTLSKKDIGNMQRLGFRANTRLKLSTLNDSFSTTETNSTKQQIYHYHTSGLAFGGSDNKDNVDDTMADDFENLNTVDTISANDNIKLDPNKKLKLIPNIDETFNKGIYLFTEDFYKFNLENLSLLELLVVQYLTNKKLNNKALMELLDSYHLWEGLEQFYYLPVLTMLVSDSLHNNFIIRG